MIKNAFYQSAVHHVNETNFASKSQLGLSTKVINQMFNSFQNIVFKKIQR